MMFTSVDSILAGDFRLMGHTSLLMFPIYGLGAFAAPVSAFLDEWLSGIPGLLRAGRERVPALGRILRQRIDLYGTHIYGRIYNRNLAEKLGNLPLGTTPCGRIM